MIFFSCSLEKLKPKSRFLFTLFVIQMQICASLQAQELRDSDITLKVNDEQIVQIFNKITRLTNYSFFYEESVLENVPLISIDLSRVSLKTILKELSFQSGLSFAIKDFTIIVSKGEDVGINPKAVPKISVSGVVIDEKGEPIIGASVAVKGGIIGTVTGLDGDFKLEIPENTTLVVSYIGFISQEVKVDGATVFQIILKEDNKLLDEIVVVGYGQMKKRDLTGSITSINAKDIVSVPVTSAVESLQGRASGVVVSTSNWSPGEIPSILIRGKRSINASNEPLFVVDGIPITGGIGEISPADIETMEVLKDASATAIYGARGANGVIIITTKQGKEGKTYIDYNGYVGFQTIQNKLEMMDGAEYAEYTREAYRNSSGANKYLSDTPHRDQDMLVPMFKQDAYVLESIMMAYDEQGNYDPSKVRSFNWFDEVTRAGVLTDHQLNIRGGGAKTNFMASAIYNKISGVIKNQDYERYSIRFNINHTINDYLRFGGNTQYSGSEKNRGSGLEKNFYLYRITPLGCFLNEDGTIPGLVGGDSQMYNPLMDFVPGAVDRPLKVTRFLGSYFAEIKFPIEGLAFRSNLGIDSKTVRDYEYYASDTTERQLGTSFARNAVDIYSTVTWENYFSYIREFNKKHSWGVTLLQSVQQDIHESLEGKVQDLPSDILKYYDLATGLMIDGVESDYVKWNMASFMGRVNYGFMGRYLLTASARYDGSSRLAEGHKWVLFPSFAFAWRLNEERFMKNLAWIDNLKIRLGYGKTGNSAVEPYQTQGQIGLTRYVFNNGANEVIGYAPSVMANKSLTWETTGQWNIGLDFGFLNGRIHGSVEIYKQRTKDLLLQRQLPIVSGFPSVISNVGSTQNKGVEVTLNTRNIINRTFTWSTNLVFASNKEEIIELYNGKVDDIGNLWFIGHPIDVYYDYEKIGIWQNTPEDLEEMAKFNDQGGNFTAGSIKLKDIDGDYKITNSDKVILGSRRPKWTASLINTIVYKGIDFSVFLYASIGGIMKNEVEYMEKPGRANTMVIDYWTPNNPTNAFPRPTVDLERVDYASTLGYDKADFLRIRNVSLGYTLPKSFSRKFLIEKLRLYISANNPYIFTKFTGIDPEGANGLTAPSYSSWMFGVNISM